MFSEYGCHVNFDVCHGGFGPTADDGYGVGYCVFGDNKSTSPGGRLSFISSLTKFLSVKSVFTALYTFYHALPVAVNFQISCWNRCQDTDAFKLAKHIAQAFEDVKALFQ